MLKQRQRDKELERERIAAEMFQELDRAHQKHGVYAMETLSLNQGFTAVVEEVGEVAKALHEENLMGHHGMREELIQLGSLAMAMVRKLDRGIGFCDRTNLH